MPLPYPYPIAQVIEKIVEKTIILGERRAITPPLWGIHCGSMGITTGECILYVMLNLSGENV
jgi:hypothetical protein